ncbi:MAG: hypothetical protein FJX77_17565, partial [Armatimonadetes bacterium]|nr:hypothetical protein [Armatimonadota bacterium]
MSGKRRVLGCALAALALASASGAQSPPVISRTVVSPNPGPGEFPTPAAALAAVVAGGTVVVRPGTYTGATLVRKAVTLLGDGPRSQIVLEGRE